MHHTSSSRRAAGHVHGSRWLATYKLYVTSNLYASAVVEQLAEPRFDDTSHDRSRRPGVVARDHEVVKRPPDAALDLLELSGVLGPVDEARMPHRKLSIADLVQSPRAARHG